MELILPSNWSGTAVGWGGILGDWQTLLVEAGKEKYDGKVRQGQLHWVLQWVD